MKTIRDYINIVNEKVTLPADGSAPQTQTVTTPSGATTTTNAPANAVQTGSGGVLKTGSGAAVTSGTPAPAPDAVAAAKAKLTPSQLKWLGGADATDPNIMARMPKPQPGEKVPGAAPAQSGSPAPAAAPAGTPPGSVDDEGNLMPGFTTDENGNVVSAGDPNFVEPATQQLAQQGRQAAKEKEYAANADAEDQAMGQAMTANAAQSAALASGAQDDVTGVDKAVAANAAAPAQSGQPANRDSMPFGQAFADARAKGETQFTWKGKPYAVKLAPPGQAPAKAAAPAKAVPPAQSGTAATPQVGKPAGMGKPGPTVAAAQGADPNNPLNQPKKESREPTDSHFVEELNLMRAIAGLPVKNKW